MSDYETLMDAISKMPAGSVTTWQEEVLLRGRPDGSAPTAHVMIGVRFTDPMGGTTQTIKGPFPLDVASADWQAVIGQTVIEQQAAITAAQAAATQADADHAAATAAAQTEAAQAAQASAAALADLTAQRDAAISQRDTAAAALATAQQSITALRTQLSQVQAVTPAILTYRK